MREKVEDMSIQQDYFRVSLPIDKVIKFHNEHLKGYANLFHDKAYGISRRIDDYFELPAEEQSSPSILIEAEKEKANELSKGFEEQFMRLNTKIACALVLEQLRMIELHQNAIEKAISPYYIPSNYHFTLKSDKPYYRVPEKTFDNMKHSVWWARKIYNYINKWKIEENFRNEILPDYIRVIGLYASIFKIEDDKKASCLGVVLFFVFVIFTGFLAVACS